MESELGICDECKHPSEHHDDIENPVCKVCSCSWYVNEADRYATIADGAKASGKYIQLTLEGRWS